MEVGESECHLLLEMLVGDAVGAKVFVSTTKFDLPLRMLGAEPFARLQLFSIGVHQAEHDEVLA